MNENQVCCFTGHRNLPQWEENSMRQKLQAVIREFAIAGIRTYCAGGAMGFDTLAEQVVLELKKEFPQIRLVLVLPCRQQEKYWPARDKAVYQNILHQADEVIYVSEEYTRGCMHKRNRRLVEMSTICVTNLSKPTGGTAYTAAYAAKKGLSIINIAWNPSFVIEKQ